MTARKPSGGALPLSFCYLECNNAPANGGSAIWDTVYDRRGAPHTLSGIPAAMGMALATPAGTINVLQAGLWLVEMVANPNSDPTANGRITLSLAGDYTGGPTFDWPDLTGVTNNEACLVSVASLVQGDGISVQANATGQTDPNYRPIGYALLKLVRFG